LEPGSQFLYGKAEQGMNKTKYHIKITFVTPVLGSQPTVDVASEFIAKKFEDNGGQLPADEAETLPESMERGTTVFHKDPNGNPLFFDYQVKGFIKEAARIFNGLHNVKALRSKVDNMVFVEPRQISIHIPEGATITFLERPLRAETAQGPRIALARSEQLPAGTWFECDVQIYDGPITDEILRDLLTYGADKGLGQWRNGGWGRFTFEIL
jgi:hypothetical protein